MLAILLRRKRAAAEPAVGRAPAGRHESVLGADLEMLPCSLVVRESIPAGGTDGPAESRPRRGGGTAEMTQLAVLRAVIRPARPSSMITSTGPSAARDSRGGPGHW